MIEKRMSRFTKKGRITTKMLTIMHKKIDNFDGPCYFIRKVMNLFTFVQDSYVER